MRRVKVVYSHAVQDSQDYASFDKGQDHVVSTLHFSLEIDGITYGNLRVEVRQPYGTDFEKEPLEVGRPVGDYPPLETWNYPAFRDLCERYYRSCVGTRGRDIHISGGTNIRMRNNKMGSPWVAEFEIPDAKSPAW